VLCIVCSLRLFANLGQDDEPDALRPVLHFQTAQSVEAPPTQPTIALCFFGLSRSLTHTHPAIQTNLIAPLEAAGYQVDVFLHTYSLAELRNARSSEVSELNQTEWQLLRPRAHEISDQAAFLEEYRCAWSAAQCVPFDLPLIAAPTQQAHRGVQAPGAGLAARPDVPEHAQRVVPAELGAARERTLAAAAPRTAVPGGDLRAPRRPLRLPLPRGAPRRPAGAPSEHSQRPCTQLL